MVTPWTSRQEEVLRAYAHMGAYAVAMAIWDECGVIRTQHAVENHASRMGVSLAVLRECPSCHALGVTLVRTTGLCPRCTMRLRVAEEQAFNDLLTAEAEGCEAGEELDELRRRYDRLRQRNSRLCRRHGLAGKRERDA